MLGQAGLARFAWSWLSWAKQKRPELHFPALVLLMKGPPVKGPHENGTTHNVAQRGKGDVVGCANPAYVSKQGSIDRAKTRALRNNADG